LKLSKYFEDLIKRRELGKIKDVRGMGLMIGIELNFDGQAVVEKMMEQNVLVNCTNGNVIRLLPPLIINNQEIETLLTKFEKILLEIRKYCEII